VLTLVCTGIDQVESINKAIKIAKKDSRLHGLPPLCNPSDEVVEVLIQCMEWNIATRQSSIAESELPELQHKAVDLLTFYKRICLKRQAKRESVILKRHTAFYTRSVRLCCGATQTIPLVKLQRYRFV
jgi:hypothetical protein